jgi:hypothetical protein
LVAVAFGRLRVTIGGGVLAVISRSAAPARAPVGSRLGAVALSRLLVTIRGGVLATTSRSAPQAGTFVSRRLGPITLSCSRLAQLSSALAIHGGMTPVPPPLIELRRPRIRFDAQLDLRTDRHSIVAVAVAVRGVRASARMMISLGQIRSGQTGCPRETSKR